MSVLSALYQTYNKALENKLVDRTDNLEQQTVLLPVYHSSKKSTGSNDMIEILLSEAGSFIKAEWIPKDKIAIFPVTESSIIRAGKVIAPHPLCDELSYLSKEIDQEKHKEYERVLKNWLSYSKDGNTNGLLEIVSGYILQGDVLKDCVSSLLANTQYQWGEGNSVIINQGDKSEKILKLDKTFVTFQVETTMSTQANLSVTSNQKLHQHYIEFVRFMNKEQPQEQCDISGESTYCVSRHRGLMGNAKLISISNHNETYYGRFITGEEIIHIGYEVSQKIHLMLKYLLENEQNRRQIGESCFIVNWFSNDIGNESAINVLDACAPFDDMTEEDADNTHLSSLGGGVASEINDYLTGTQKKISPDSRFYLMILDKSSNGRISVKYFRELPKSDLFNRVEQWYLSTSWSFYNATVSKVTKQTPPLFRYIDAVFGLENEKGFMECRNKKLRTKTMERVLPCIIEQRRLPLDIKSRMLENLCHRNSYDKAWNQAIAIGCSVFKKYQIDYKHKGEVSEMLDENNKDRSYLYGRLLAIYEKMELDSLKSTVVTGDEKRNANDDKRATNAERLWTAYSKRPASTLITLAGKIRPYMDRLTKKNPGLAISHDKLVTHVMNKLVETEEFNCMKNKALDENFIFGYYAQKQEFYKKSSKENKETDNNKEEVMSNDSN